MDLSEKAFVKRVRRSNQKDNRLVPIHKILRFREERAQKNPGIEIKQLSYQKEEILVNNKALKGTLCELSSNPKSTFLMVFSPNGKYVASTHGDHNIYISEITSGKCIQTLKGHSRTPWCIAYHPASDDLLASGSLGGEVRIWDMTGSSEVWFQPNQLQIASVSFHPNDKVLAIACDNQVHLWNWSLPRPFVSFSTADKRERVKYVRFDKMGTRLLTGVSNIVVPYCPERQRVTSENRPDSSQRYNPSGRRYTSYFQRDESPPPVAVPDEASTSSGLLDMPSVGIYRANDDSNSSSTLDSTSSSSTASNRASPTESDSRLSVLWSRTAAEPQETTGLNGFDIEERTGEGNVMREFEDRTDRRPSDRFRRYQEQRRRPFGRGSSPPVDPRHPAMVRHIRRRKNEGGRWMYFCETTRMPNARNAPSTSGVASTSTDPPALDALSNLDPHFGVQLLSRHTENMQRICRSLAIPRAYSELLHHQDEIVRLQHIRIMLYYIQRQIRLLRTSVDETMEELPSGTRLNPESNSENGSLTGLMEALSRLPEAAPSSDYETSLVHLVSICERISTLERVNEVFNPLAAASPDVTPSMPPATDTTETAPQASAFSETSRIRREAQSIRRRRSFRQARRILERAVTREDMHLIEAALAPYDFGVESMAADYWDRRPTVEPSLYRPSRHIQSPRIFDPEAPMDPSPRRFCLEIPIHPPIPHPVDDEGNSLRTPRPPTTSLASRLAGMIGEGRSVFENSTSERSTSPVDVRASQGCTFGLSAERRRQTTDSTARNSRIDNHRDVFQRLAHRRHLLTPQQSRSVDSEPTTSDGPRDLLARTQRLRRTLMHSIERNYLETHAPYCYAAGSVATFRLQSWHFDPTSLPDLSDRVSGMVIPNCKIHFDSSIAVAEDESFIGALVMGIDEKLSVGLYSYQESTMGDVLYMIAISDNALCLSISPTLRHIIVGLTSHHSRWTLYPADKEVIAAVYLINDYTLDSKDPIEPVLPEVRSKFKLKLSLVRNIEHHSELRNMSINSIKWLPHPGQGFIYGTNRGHLVTLS